MSKKIQALLAVAGALTLGLAACSPEAAKGPETASTEAPPEIVPMPVSQNAMMVAVIDFAADGIWRPADPDKTLTDADWDLAHQDAVALAAATSLMSVPSAGGERDAAFLADPDWRKWTLELKSAAMEAVSATDAKDKAALTAAGDKVVAVCVACHTKFKPGMPGGGVTRYGEYPKRPGA